MAGLDANSIIPLYRQLMDLILVDISSGKLKPNQKIPTEEEFSRLYSISRMTVRKALAQLVEEGILSKKQGKGTYVREPKMVEDLEEANSFTNLCRRNGKKPGGRTLIFDLEEPSDRDIKELRLIQGEKVIHIQRLRTADDEPVMLENLYFPGHLKAIMTENLEDSSLYQILQDKYGLRDEDYQIEIETSECNPYESSLLGIKSGSVLLLVREIIYDQYGSPLHRTKSLLRGDKIKYISSKMTHANRS